jgi:hypothetical protein
MDDGLDLNDLPGEAARRGPRKVALSKPKKLQPRPEPVRQRPAQQFVDIADMYRYRGHHHHQNPQRNQRQNVSFDYWDILSKLILFTVVLAAGYVAVVAGIFVVSIVLELVQFVFDVIETIVNAVLGVVGFIFDVINAILEAISFVINLFVSIVTFILEVIEVLFWTAVAIIIFPFWVIYSILMYVDSVLLWFFGFFS